MGPWFMLHEISANVLALYWYITGCQSRRCALAARLQQVHAAKLLSCRQWVCFSGPSSLELHSTAHLFCPYTFLCRLSFCEPCGTNVPQDVEIHTEMFQGKGKLAVSGLQVVRIVGDSLTALAEYLERPRAAAASSPERFLREAMAVREGRAAPLSDQPSHEDPFRGSPRSCTRTSPQHSPQYPPQSSPPHSPQASPRYSPQASSQYSPHASPQYSPQASPPYSPRYSPQYSPGSSPRYSLQPSPQHSPRLAEAGRHHPEEDIGGF